MTRSAFSTAAFAQLVRRLRYSNTRYKQIAHQCRSKIRPSHHARRHAFRAGLRIDTSKARACPAKFVSTKPLPVIESPLSPVTNLPQLSLTALGGSVPLTNLPDVAVPVPIKQRRVDRRQRVTTRVSVPLALNLNFGYDQVLTTPLQGSAPNAPLLKPAELPEEESDMEEISLLHSSSSSSFTSTDSFESLLTPLDVTYSGLCITIPPRSLKRKLDDVDQNENAMPPSPSQPKRIMKTRWRTSQGHQRVGVQV